MREWFIAGSKLLGIYYFYLALTTVPPTFGMVLSTFSQRSIFEGLPLFTILVSVFSAIVMLSFAFVLLFKTELIADKLNISGSHQPSTLKGDKLEIGIILIGIYLFCTEIGVLAEIFASNQWASKIRNPFAATQPQGMTFSSNYIAPLVTLVASLLLIFGAKHIAAFLRKEKPTETEQSNQPDAE